MACFIRILSQEYAILARGYGRYSKLIQPISICSNSSNIIRRYSGIQWSEVKPYNAIRVIVNQEDATITANHLINEMKSYITDWKKEGRSAIWLHLPIVHCGLISCATEMGFTLHHAFNNEIVLSQWLDDSRPNKLPHFASHQVGVCGVVIREDTREILVTQDKYKPAKWKFPGGLSEFAEDIAQTAEREVLEETGIVSEFQSVLAFRQHHHLPIAFNQSDLYFICRMKPLSYEITPCVDEVLKCQWLPARELQLSPLATQLTNRIAEIVLKGIKDGFEQFDINCEEWPSILQGHTYKLFIKGANSNNDE